MGRRCDDLVLAIFSQLHTGQSGQHGSLRGERFLRLNPAVGNRGGAFPPHSPSAAKTELRIREPGGGLQPARLLPVGGQHGGPRWCPTWSRWP